LGDHGILEDFVPLEEALYDVRLWLLVYRVSPIRDGSCLEPEALIEAPIEALIEAPIEAPIEDRGFSAPGSSRHVRRGGLVVETTLVWSDYRLRRLIWESAEHVPCPEIQVIGPLDSRQALRGHWGLGGPLGGQHGLVGALTTGRPEVFYDV
jgi:hypothetical protein